LRQLAEHRASRRLFLCSSPPICTRACALCVGMPRGATQCRTRARVYTHARVYACKVSSSDSIRSALGRALTRSEAFEREAQRRAAEVSLRLLLHAACVHRKWPPPGGHTRGWLPPRPAAVRLNVPPLSLSRSLSLSLSLFPLAPVRGLAFGWPVLFRAACLSSRCRPYSLEFCLELCGHREADSGRLHCQGRAPRRVGLHGSDALPCLITCVRSLAACLPCVRIDRHEQTAVQHAAANTLASTPQAFHAAPAQRFMRLF
jgi:hypothetical protein